MLLGWEAAIVKNMAFLELKLMLHRNVFTSLLQMIILQTLIGTDEVIVL